MSFLMEGVISLPCGFSGSTAVSGSSYVLTKKSKAAGAARRPPLSPLPFEMTVYARSTTLVTVIIARHGSKPAKSSIIVEQLIWKGKGKERVVDVDPGMEEGLGSPQMIWSAFTLKDSLEVSQLPREEEEEAEAEVPSLSTLTVALSLHDHPPILMEELSASIYYPRIPCMALERRGIHPSSCT
ncbi:hypothetical protein BDQ17DRAFT_1333827 [Cyathus striatus]|nr:hypothetical protein BDQ17DRAFT_1333827 [Cyathus striatus]